MVERSKIPTKSQILEAERHHAIGEYEIAREKIAGIREFPLDNFSKNRLSQQKRLLTAARISASSSISLAREHWAAPAVATDLAQARNIIVAIYDHAEVQATAKEVKTGINNKPYEYHTEMRRDKILYTLTLARLTGNPELLTTAITEMDNAIVEAEEPTAKTLLQFDQQRLRHRQTATDISFAKLTTVFEAATQASVEAQNWERAATIAARYILDAEKLGDQTETAVVAGYEVYDQAVRNDEALTDLLNRERVKERVEINKQVYWKATTPDGVDYSNLALPVSTNK